MKLSTILLLIVTTVAPTLTLAAPTAQEVIVGLWTLRGQTCEPEGGLLARLKARVTQSDRTLHGGEVIVLSPDGAIRKFDAKGQFISEGDYTLVRNDEILIQTVQGKKMPERMQIIRLNGSELQTAHKNEAQCKGGEIKSSYLRVRTFAQRSNLNSAL